MHDIGNTVAGSAIRNPHHSVRLDVIIPTYKRPFLLAKALASLQHAFVPPALDVAITVVDNNSGDDTAQVVSRFQKEFGGCLHYLLEERPGRSHALNAGIRATRGDLIGMIDDDEEVHPTWFATVHSAFRQLDIDFVGGPYRAHDGVPLPPWLPPGYSAIIGVTDAAAEEQDFGPEHPGMLMGGNAVVRRTILDRIGLYNTALGRTPDGLLSGEDDDMYCRLLAAGARGRYLPQLVVYHHISPARLTKGYHRRWCFWHGVSMSVLNRPDDLSSAQLLGIPRYVLGAAVRGMFSIGGMLLRGRYVDSQALANELKVWSAAGRLYGRYWHQRKRLFGTDAQ